MCLYKHIGTYVSENSRTYTNINYTYGIHLLQTIFVHSMFEDEKPSIINNSDMNENRASRVSNEIQDLI